MEKRQLHQKASGNLNSDGYVDDEIEWAYLYSQVEVNSRFKKINQTYFIRNVIGLIKEEFNSKFEAQLKLRNEKTCF